MAEATSWDETVRRVDFDRYLSSLFAPAALRSELNVLYAFNHQVAKTAETVSQPIAGQIRLHMRARTGLRIEETARLADQVNQTVRQVIPQDELVTILDNIGLPYSGINLSYSNAGTIGSSDAEILVQLKSDRGKGTAEYINQLRGVLAQRFPGVQFFFQPADIVTQILNFGTPAPIDVAITGISAAEKPVIVIVSARGRSCS